MGLEIPGDLNSGFSPLEPALDEQVQVDMIRSCLHSVLPVPPEPQGEGAHQEVLPCIRGGQRAGRGGWGAGSLVWLATPLF